MPTMLDVAAQYFPGEPAEYLDHIIWDETGFPCFWNIPQDGNTPLECFTTQLARAAARENFGFYGYRSGEQELADHYGLVPVEATPLGIIPVR